MSLALDFLLFMAALGSQFVSAAPFLFLTGYLWRSSPLTVLTLHHNLPTKVVEFLPQKTS
jgi:hypothetical protein